MIQTRRPTLPFWRSHTSLKAQPIAFFLDRGGIGDFINWCTPIMWAIENHSHLYGHIYCPHYFVDLAKHWFSRFEPRIYVEGFERAEECAAMYDPKIMKLRPSGNESANPIGMHLMDLGWIYYCHLDERPSDTEFDWKGGPGWTPNKYDTLLPIDLDDCMTVIKFKLYNSFAVVHTESIFEVRTLPASTINEINAWLISQSITPVFLGRKSLNKDIHTRDNTDIDFSVGIDLRDRTNLVEAAQIMAEARVVVGLDNGLLHLASCTMTPVVFALSNIHPKHRAPRRRRGAKTVMLTPGPELGCRFCQSQMRMIDKLNFRHCFYNDIKCCEMLTSEMFIEAIKEVMNGPS